jgi:hypothetical protein
MNIWLCPVHETLWHALPGISKIRGFPGPNRQGDKQFPDSGIENFDDLDILMSVLRVGPRYQARIY